MVIVFLDFLVICDVVYVIEKEIFDKKYIDVLFVLVETIPDE